MNSGRSLILIAAAAAALAAPAGADAAVCAKNLVAMDAPFVMKQDGSMHGTATLAEGSNFASDHGRLSINTNEYLPVEENVCTTTDTSIKYPTRAVWGALSASREIAVVADRIRWVDTIYNTSNETKHVDIDFAVRVLGSQHVTHSEVGTAAVNDEDHWSVHENDGGSYPYMRWGQWKGGGINADVVSLGSDPTVWKPDLNGMPNARLRYEDVPIEAGKSVQLMHTSGTNYYLPASIGDVNDGAAPFTGMSQADAIRIINWGNDSDEDGVDKFNDKCPAYKGSKPDGCLKLEGKPGDEPAPDKPADGGGANGGNETPAPAPAPTATPAPAAASPAPAAPPAPVTPRAADRKAPGVKVTKLGRSAKRSLLTGRGLKPRVACDETCSVRVQITARKRGSRKATTLATTRATPLAAAARSIRLKLKAGRLSRLAKAQVTVVITATDAAGNRTSVTRTVKVGR